MQIKAAPPGGPASSSTSTFSMKSFGPLCSGPVLAENAGGNPVQSQAESQPGCVGIKGLTP